MKCSRCHKEPATQRVAICVGGLVITEVQYGDKCFEQFKNDPKWDVKENSDARCEN